MDIENLKMNPYTYYNLNLPEIKEFENNNPENSNQTLNIYDQIEKKIKNKYNMLIPAIFMEIKKSKIKIEFNKDDLKTVKLFFLF